MDRRPGSITAALLRRRGLVLLALFGGALLPGDAIAARAAQVQYHTAHVVKRGDSLSGIAHRYGCSVEELRELNGISGNKIHRGEALAIPPCDGAPKAVVAKAPAAAPVHRVRRGESLSRIARDYGCSVDALRTRNDLTGSVIMPGQELVIPGGEGEEVPAPRVVGQSVGAPQLGRLVNPARLKRGDGYLLRRPDRTYATSQLIDFVTRAVKATREAHPAMHTLAVGDLSARRGGAISGHRSHQSGRDIDLGLVFKERPAVYPQEFSRGTPENLDLAATWTLVRELAETAKKDGGVEVIFLDYELQRALYKWARDHGVSRALLKRVLQYPSGRWAEAGVVRHFPNHADHLHARFRCPNGDKGCS